MNKSFAIPVSSCIARDVHLCIMVYIWIRSRNCSCLVTRPCYQLIAKPGNKTATVTWPDPYSDFKRNNKRLFLINEPIVERIIVPAASQFFRSLIWNEWYINLPKQFKILTSSLLIRNKNLSSSLRLLKSPYTLLILSYIHSLASLLIIHWQTKCSSSSITVHWEQSRASKRKPPCIGGMELVSLSCNRVFISAESVGRGWCKFAIATKLYQFHTTDKCGFLFMPWITDQYTFVRYTKLVNRIWTAVAKVITFSIMTT